MWFSDFAAHAAAHGLDYVGEADLRQLLPGRIPPELEPEVRALAGDDPIAYEQHADLLLCTHFRQTLLCHEGLRIDRSLAPGRMRRLAFAGRAGTDTVPRRPGLLAHAHELLQARAPDTVGFEEIQRALGAEAPALADALLEGFEAELLMPHVAPLRAGDATAQRPVASPLARWQARRGPDVTSLAYANVSMEEPPARLLLCLLDGTRDRAAVRAEFAERTGVRLSAEDLDANLRALAKLFLLVRS